MRKAIMTPAGYMAKRVSKKPEWLCAPNVTDIYSISSCVSEDFADYINFWKHNGYWFFDSPEVIKSIAEENSIQLLGVSLFYYEAHELEFDDESWKPWSPESSMPTRVAAPAKKQLEGLTWLLFTPETHQNIPLSRATA